MLPTAEKEVTHARLRDDDTDVDKETSRTSLGEGFKSKMNEVVCGL